MYTLNTVLIVVGMLIVIVAIHEFGHMITAKAFGIKVYKYAIGMGPTIWKKNWKGTEFSFRWFLIGGFVIISGQLPDFPKGKTTWIIANNDSEILFFGLKDDLKKIISSDDLKFDMLKIIPKCDENESGEVVDKLSENTYRITDNTKIVLKDRYSVAKYNEKMFAKPLYQQVLVLLMGCVLNFVLSFVLLIGMYSIHFKQSIGRSSHIALYILWEVLSKSIESVVSLFTHFVQSYHHMSGIVGVAGVVHHAVITSSSNGSVFWYAVWITALLSASIGVMNLLPISPLDGFLILKSLISKIVSIPYNFLLIVQGIGVVAVLLFMVLVNTQNAISLLVK